MKLTSFMVNREQLNIKHTDHGTPLKIQPGGLVVGTEVQELIRHYKLHCAAGLSRVRAVEVTRDLCHKRNM